MSAKDELERMGGGEWTEDAGEGKSWQWGRGSRSHGDGKFWVGKWMMEFRMDDEVAIFGYDDSRTENRSGRRAFTG